MKNSFLKTLILALTVALSFSLVACGSVSGGPNNTCNHKLVVDEAINPTCESIGLTSGVHCSVCDAVLTKQEVVPALGHNYENNVCTRCGKQDTSVTPHEHTVVTDEAIAPTCESIGLTEGSHCSTCDAVLVKQEVVPALGHNYENNVCTRCGEKDPESIPHEHVIVIDKAVEPTCEEAGLTEGKHCEICDKVIVAQEQIPALEHKEVQDIGYNSTCTQTGLTNGVHCERCGKVLTAQEVIETVPHTPSDWIIDKNSSIHEEGSQHKECTVCFEVLETEVLPKGYSSGFDYQVNADGETLTITGIGDCEDAEVGIPKSINGYTVTAIGENAFSEQTQITQIALPETLTSIGTRAFYGCTGLTEFTLPKSVTSIGTQIFYNCSNLSTVYYNCNYGSLSNQFMSVASIKTVIFGGTEIPYYALNYCSNVTSVIIGDSVTSIGEKAFYGCSSLTSIEIGASVTSIGDFAFYDCRSLTSIEIPDSVTSIGKGAFDSCTSLISIGIPDSVTFIGYSAFFGCSSLTSVVIPDSVTYIGEYIFFYCSSLTSVVIGGSVTYIGNYAFYGCSSLTSIEVSENNANYSSLNGNLYNKDKTTLIQYAIGKKDSEFKIPDSVTSIGEGAFYECYSLTSVVIGGSVTSIGWQAFYDCRSLTSVVIPDSVTSIVEAAFYECNNLGIVYYKGTQSEWNQITIDSWNDSLIIATRYYYSENEPSEEGNYWHYVDGEIVVW